MRNPPDRYSSPPPDDAAPNPNQGGRRARTIRDMFAKDAPLRRLTSAPLRRRNAPDKRGQESPPDLYDLAPHAGPAPKQRWTEPGVYTGPERGPDQTDVRRPNRPPEREPYQPPYAEAPREPADGPASGGYDRPAEAADMRWNRPGWLGKAPAPGEIPPIDPAPPTTPRYFAPGDPETPQYHPTERDPDRLETDYRATSVRAAFWASRTPNYQPDLPPELVERDTTEEREYFEAYDTRRAPASLAHAQASLSSANSQSYAPGAISEVERLRRDAQGQGRTAGPAPYFWEMVKKPQKASPLGVVAFWLISVLLDQQIWIYGCLYNYASKQTRMS